MCVYVVAYMYIVAVYIHTHIYIHTNIHVYTCAYMLSQELGLTERCVSGSIPAGGLRALVLNVAIPQSEFQAIPTSAILQSYDLPLVDTKFSGIT